MQGVPVLVDVHGSVCHKDANELVPFHHHHFGEQLCGLESGLPADHMLTLLSLALQTTVYKPSTYTKTEESTYYETATSMCNDRVMMLSEAGNCVGC